MSDVSNEILRADSIIVEPHGAIEVAHAMELSPQAAADLALVGLSTQFPARMKALNDAMTWEHKGSFQGFRFTLSPDEVSPDMTIEKLTSPPFVITFDAHPGSLGQPIPTAQFDIAPRDWGSNITTATASQLIDFASNYPTEGGFFFQAEPIPMYRRREKDKDLELDPLRVPLTNICMVTDLSEIGIDPFTSGYDLSVILEHRAEKTEDNPKPILERVVMPVTYPFDINGGNPAQSEKYGGKAVFHVKGFSARGASSDIERAIDVFSNFMRITQAPDL